jgi:hypothetical protein
MRLSLIYPAFYLSMAGLGCALQPELFLKLMFSNTHYEPGFVRFTGILLIGLAAIVIQTIRHRIQALYATLIGVRLFFCGGYLVLYYMTGDPLFVSVFGIVAVGLIASTISYGLDRGPRP